MGLLDRFRRGNKNTEENETKVIKSNVNNSVEESKVPFYSHTTPIYNSNEEVYINNIRYVWSNTNSQATNFDIYVARAQRCIKGQARNLENSDYICFQIEKDNNIDKELMDNIAFNYMQEKIENPEDNNYFLGEILKRGKEYLQGEKSKKIINWFKEYVLADMQLAEGGLTAAQAFRNENKFEGVKTLPVQPNSNNQHQINRANIGRDH